MNGWVKKGILLGFRLGAIVDMSIDTGRQPWFDKATYPVKRFAPDSGVRIVPGGSTIRDGCYVGQRRHLHAADVYQRRRLCRRRHDGRFSCVDRKLRTGRGAMPHLGCIANWRRARACRRAAGHHRR